jgi:predicted permease
MFWNDTRYTLRLMRRSPGFTAVAVLSLALGIGANTAIFSLFNLILLRTLPVAHPEQLVGLLQKYPGEPRGGYWSWRSFEHIRDNNHVFSDMTTTGFDNLMRVRTDTAEIDTVVGENVLGNYFAFLGLKPVIGRLIGPEDVPAKGDGAVVVVSWSYWNSRFDRDPSIVGKRIFLNDEPKTIIGVAPRAYVGPRVGARTDIWLPQGEGGGAIFARLKAGVTIEQARAEMQVLYRFTIEERAATSKDSLVRQLTVEVEAAATGMSHVRDAYGKPLVLLMCVVGVLLLLACVNMASMLLARGASRQRELAVRAGLGATRGRLVRQMLTEGVILSSTGTLVGVFLAYFGTGILVRIIGSGRAHERIDLSVQPDLHLLLFTTGIAVLTGLLFGAAPAWHAFGVVPDSGLRQGGRAGESRSLRLFGKSLVAAQVSLSIVLVTGAFVFLNHLSRLRSQDLGFRSERVLLVQLDPSRSGYRREQLAVKYPELLERLRAVGGVKSVSVTGCTPIQGCGASRFVTAEGFTEPPEDRRFTALSWVAPKYFETLGIPLIAGRDFSFADVDRSRVAMISQSMAQHYFANASPVGKRISIDRDPKTGGWYGDDQPYEVIGVVGDVRQHELRDPPQRMMYFNMFQEARIVHQLVLRTDGKPVALNADVRQAVRDVLKSVSVTRVTTLSDQIDSAIVPERLIATLSGCFGLLGGVLAGIGLYGLLAYTVMRRINEIGVRMAVGATTGNIIRMVFSDALGMVTAGVAMGVLLVMWSRPIAARLVEDLRVPTAVPVAVGAFAVIAVAMLASSLPARRAALVDPMEALRQE